MTTANTLPGGFTQVTKIERAAEVQKAIDVVVVLRGVANLDRLARLMRIGEGTATDLRSGHQGKLKGQQLK